MYQSSQVSFCMYCGNNASSALERMVRPHSEDYQRTFHYEAAAPSVVPIIYSSPVTSRSFSYLHSLELSNNYQNKTTTMLEDFFKTRINTEYSFFPDDFLKPDRKSQKFVGQAEEVKSYVEDIFQELTGKEFPEDIQVKICSHSEFQKLTSHPGVVGLSINRKEDGLISDIFILNDELDKVLLTIGHELGHVLSRSLKDQRDEEAKAFAFSFAWMEVIKEKNIANLGSNIAFGQPANNGLHDLAFNFVWKLIKEGKKSLEIYTGLIAGLFKVSFSQ